MRTSEFSYQFDCWTFSREFLSKRLLANTKDSISFFWASFFHLFTLAGSSMLLICLHAWAKLRFLEGIRPKGLLRIHWWSNGAASRFWRQSLSRYSPFQQLDKRISPSRVGLWVERVHYCVLIEWIFNLVSVYTHTRFTRAECPWNHRVNTRRVWSSLNTRSHSSCR